MLYFVHYTRAGNSGATVSESGKAFLDIQNLPIRRGDAALPLVRKR